MILGNGDEDLTKCSILSVRPCVQDLVAAYEKKMSENVGFDIQRVVPFSSESMLTVICALSKTLVGRPVRIYCAIYSNKLLLH